MSATQQAADLEQVTTLASQLAVGDIIVHHLRGGDVLADYPIHSVETYTAGPDERVSYQHGPFLNTRYAFEELTVARPRRDAMRSADTITLEHQAALDLIYGPELPMRPMPANCPAPRNDWWNIPSAASAWGEAGCSTRS